MHVQETGLSVLEPAECSHFGQALSADSDIEICTGRKTKFPIIQQYIQTVTRDGMRVGFKKEGMVRNLLGTNEKGYDFYLGGSDSCSGILINWN